ncbi:MAG: hypothetical protein HY673_05680 [Chloroflexi bacterium]|nr:hypothetical protein [Chloroflexota bacterium]
MAEETRPRVPFDEYADQFTITVTPFGANLSFAVREAHPAPGGRIPQAIHLGTVRMSVEHLKTMVVMIRRQVMQVEAQTNVTADVPGQILNQLQIAPEDWQSFWKG